MASAGDAPSFFIPSRKIVAVEHPMVIMNIDNGLKTFGTGTPLVQLFDPDGIESCIPIYLRPMDRTCAPTLSCNNATRNVLLKVTVPKRTGRKRKRGSDEPYAPEIVEGVSEQDGPPGLRSHSRLDNPKNLLRSLKDNAENYDIEAVGLIHRTHRYRGSADFHYSTTHGKFMTNFREHVLSGKLEDLKKFELDPSKGVKENTELIPPPAFTDKTVPINWGYHQNPTIRMKTDKLTGEKTLVNQSYAERLTTTYLPYDADVIPSTPPPLATPDPMLKILLVELKALFEERPVWSRRALANCLPESTPGVYLLKTAIQYVGYLFRGGPFRDLIVKYGIDPRANPKYRIYQAMVFKVVTREKGAKAGHNAPWNDARTEYSRRQDSDPQDRRSHIFDGKSISLDGKIWQICDITDPLALSVLKDAPVREKFDILSDGWYCNGTYAKVRRILRYKISAIRIGKEITDEDFQPTLELPDIVEGRERMEAPKPKLKFRNGEIVRDRPRKPGPMPTWMTDRYHRNATGQFSHREDSAGSREMDSEGFKLEDDIAHDGTMMKSGAKTKDVEEEVPYETEDDDVSGEEYDEDLDDDDEDDEDDEDSDLDPDGEGDASSEDDEAARGDAEDWDLDDQAREINTNRPS